jgi:hypothetical protein
MQVLPRLRRAAAAAATVALVLAPSSVAAAAGAGQTEVVVVHGVPNLAVDILLNGEVALANVNYGEIAKVTLPSGSYLVTVAATGTTTPVLEDTFVLPQRTSLTLAAHLDAAGAPKLAGYVNERGATGIQPFHLAAFGAVDILAGGSAVLSGVTNSQTARIDVPGGTTVPNVGIAPAGSTTAAVSLGNVTVPANTLVLAYAIGDGDNLSVITTTVAVTTPAGVPAGSAGLASTGLDGSVLALLMVLGLLTLAAPALAARRS